MIVAHPDDETLWGAGLLFRYPKNWTVICCTIPYHDPIRAEKFHEACAVLGATNSVVRQHGERAGPIEIHDLSYFDLIVTHNAAGEYGHVQHKELHNAIKPRWPDKTISFGYGGNNPKMIVPVDKERKLAALKCYDHVSPTDAGKTKWQALLDVFEPRFNLWRETYEW